MDLPSKKLLVLLVFSSVYMHCATDPGPVSFSNIPSPIFSCCLETELQKGASGGSTQGTFQATPFSSGNVDDSFGRKDSDNFLDSSGYHPPFPLPESLFNHLVSICSV